MLDLLQELKTGKILLCDGAMGTQLHKRGLPLRTCPESWNLLRPDDVVAVSAEYIAAGCDIVETNTLGGTHLMLAHFGLEDRALEINLKAVELARRASGNRHYVFGSVGPTGELMNPPGSGRELDIVGSFARQIKAVAQGGADAICIETQISLHEAMAALKAAKETAELPVLVTLTFNRTPSGQFRTIMGDPPERMVEKLTAEGADVIGSNCGQGPGQMLELCRMLRPITALPLMFQPNAGLPVFENGHAVFKATPDDMADAAIQLRAAGANIIGGCCGTTPAHLKAMRKKLDETI